MATSAPTPQMETAHSVKAPRQAEAPHCDPSRPTLPTPTKATGPPPQASQSAPEKPLGVILAALGLPDGSGPRANSFDELSISELAALFKTFKNLDKSVQAALIDYMKSLEKTNPAKVTELKRQIHS